MSRAHSEKVADFFDKKIRYIQAVKGDFYLEIDFNCVRSPHRPQRDLNEIICKGCGAADYVKNGNVRGLQRYRCKACGCNFTMTKARGKPPAIKALAVLLYAMGNMRFCGIADCWT